MSKRRGDEPEKWEEWALAFIFWILCQIVAGIIWWVVRQHLNLP